MVGDFATGEGRFWLQAVLQGGALVILFYMAVTAPRSLRVMRNDENEDRSRERTAMLMAFRQELQSERDHHGRGTDRIVDAIVKQTDALNGKLEQLHDDLGKVCKGPPK